MPDLLSNNPRLGRASSAFPFYFLLSNFLCDQTSIAASPARTRPSSRFDGVDKGFLDRVPRCFSWDSQHLGRAEEKRFFVPCKTPSRAQIIESKEDQLFSVSFSALRAQPVGETCNAFLRMRPLKIRL